MAGTRAKSRSRAMAAPTGRGPDRPPVPPAGAGVPVSVTAGVDSVSDMVAIDSFHGGYHFVVTPAPGQLAHDAAGEHHQDAVADAQVVQLVGDDQRGRAALSDLVHDTEQRLFGAHVDPGGRRDEDQQ